MGLLASRRGRRLVQPQGPGLAALDHDGHRLLHRGGRGRHGPLRQPGDLQYGQGSQFTSREFTGLLIAADIRISMDGQGHLARQRLRRTPLEIGQIRGGLSARLCQRV